MSTQTQESIKEVVEVSVNETSIATINEATSLAETVRSLTITNNQEYQNSGEFLKKIKTVSKMIDDARKDITKPLDDAKKRVMDFFREPLTQLSDAEKMLKGAILGYQQEQNRIAEEERRKAEAKAKAEEERKRKALEERAAKAEENGNSAKAEMLREQADDVRVKTVVAPARIEKVQGIATKKVWKAKIQDYTKIPSSFYLNDPKVQDAIQSAMNNFAKGTKGNVPVEGVEFFQEESLSAGRV